MILSNWKMKAMLNPRICHARVIRKVIAAGEDEAGQLECPGIETEAGRRYALR